MSVGLFIGVESQTWGYNQFRDAVSWSLEHAIDTLYVKAFDGATLWNGGPTALRTLLGDIQTMRVVPYGFCYGDTYGALGYEVNNAHQCASVFGTVCLDVEEPFWNSPVSSGWAARFAGALMPYSVLISCQANPASKGNQIQALKAFTSIPALAYAPQVYDSYLDTQWQNDFAHVGPVKIQPTYILDSSVGPNPLADLLVRAKSVGITDCSLWHYGLALARPEDVAFVQQSMKVEQAKVTYTTWQSPAQEQQAQETWDIAMNVVGHTFPGSTLCNYNSGIGKAWQAAYWNGTNYGFALTPEMTSVDWGAKKIVVVHFSSGYRCEWSDKGANWLRS